MSSDPIREEALFADALALPAAERSAFLAKACGENVELLATILSLIAAHENTDSLARPLDRPIVIPEEQQGDWIGRYKLLQKIGEGGCGVVWMAEQEEPVRRHVALKVIKLGMDTREVIARFSAERQALAMMDHPGIAKVLDAGSTEAGRPYFVMDLVRGVKITKYCDDQQLDVTARLSLFVQVCDAVQHAHQKGIIHRDLKPSNILVSLVEKVPIPKVIDFGIAKATQGRLTDATLVTALDQFMGTPAYMSPEQAASPSFDIDTRSDVYSLGILLYELLVGKTPFDPRTLGQSTPDEMRRIIREVEPAKLSTQFRTLVADERMKLAKARTTDPARLALTLSGDLEWIVMRALEKNRARRYETPSALADDIGRHLSHQLVVARPPGTLYRMGKFTRRHRLGVFAATAVGFVLIAGTVVSTLQAVRATNAEHVANTERNKAVQSRASAEKLLDFMLGELRDDVQKLGKLALLEKVGDQATAYFAALEPRELNDTALLQQAKTLRQIAEVQFDKARYDVAMQSLVAAMERATVLLHRQPANGEALFERAQGEFWIGAVHMRRGELASASESWARYREHSIALLKMDPANYRWKREFIAGVHNFAVLEMEHGRFERAEGMFESEREMVEELRLTYPEERQLEFRLADISSWLGTAAERRADFVEASRRYRDQTTRLEALLRREPDNMRWRQRLADSLGWQADVMAVTGRRTEARECLVRAQALMDALVKHDPAHRRWQLGAFYVTLKSILLAQAEGNLADAERALRDVRPRLEALFAEEPTDRTFAARLVMAWRLEAELHAALDRSDASSVANRAVELARRFNHDTAGDSRIIGEWALAGVTAGAVAHAAGQSDVAATHWQAALDVLSSRVAESKDWRLLDAAVRALLLSKRPGEAAAIISRLEAAGYRPLMPWPTVAPTVSR